MKSERNDEIRMVSWKNVHFVPENSDTTMDFDYLNTYFEMYIFT